MDAHDGVGLHVSLIMYGNRWKYRRGNRMGNCMGN